VRQAPAAAALEALVRQGAWIMAEAMAARTAILVLQRAAEQGARHLELGMDCYFCDPYAAWQKGTLEALNGVLRRYLPRSTDLNTLDQEELTDICEELNDRPMKVLGFHTPREMLHSELGLVVALHL
jgi:hypothetical protein